MSAQLDTVAIPTMRSRLDSLAGCGDTASLRVAVSKLCGEFGGLARIDILTMAGAEKKRRALCLLRLGSAAQEERLMTSVGASRFGDDLLVIVDLAGSI